MGREGDCPFDWALRLSSGEPQDRRASGRRGFDEPFDELQDEAQDRLRTGSGEPQGRLRTGPYLPPQGRGGEGAAAHLRPSGSPVSSTGQALPSQEPFDRLRAGSIFPRRGEPLRVVYYGGGCLYIKVCAARPSTGASVPAVPARVRAPHAASPRAASRPAGPAVLFPLHSMAAACACGRGSFTAEGTEITEVKT